MLKLKYSVCNYMIWTTPETVQESEETVNGQRKFAYETIRNSSHSIRNTFYPNLTTLRILSNNVRATPI